MILDAIEWLLDLLPWRGGRDDEIPPDHTPPPPPE